MSINTAEAAITDKLLIERLRKGDDSAYAEVVNRYWDKTYARVHQMLKSKEDAEEVTQDAFIRAHRGIEGFRGDASFSTWLYQIATNLAHNRYWYWWRRKKDKSMSISQPIGEDGTGTFEDLLESPQENPTEKILMNELQETVDQCLPSLSDKHREILYLRLKQNFSYEEIAQNLEISVGTVKSRIARARESLREKIGTEFQ